MNHNFHSSEIYALWFCEENQWKVILFNGSVKQTAVLMRREDIRVVASRFFMKPQDELVFYNPEDGEKPTREAPGFIFSRTDVATIEKFDEKIEKITHEDENKLNNVKPQDRFCSIDFIDDHGLLVNFINHGKTELSIIFGIDQESLDIMRTAVDAFEAGVSSPDIDFLLYNMQHASSGMLH